jgi:hypothetical protein
LQRLIRYALHCGIGASLNALLKNVSPFVKLATAGIGTVAATPDRLLLGVVRERDEDEPGGIVRAHFFALGAPLETARWLHAVVHGEFDVDESGTGFVTRA